MKYYVYWIHLPEHRDVWSEGYIGVTYNVEHRYKQHLSNARLGQRYPKIMRESLLNGTAKCTTLVEADVAGCRAFEGVLRPSPYVGWNRAVGNDGGCALVHGLSGTPTSRAYYNMRTRAKKTGKVFGWDNLESFAEFYQKVFVQGTELVRIDPSGDFTPSNIIAGTHRAACRQNKLYELHGRWYCLAELAELSGSKANSILTRLRRGWPLEEAVYGR